jgi:hypothetical protein
MIPKASHSKYLARQFLEYLVEAETQRCLLLATIACRRFERRRCPIWWRRTLHRVQTVVFCAEKHYLEEN